MTAEPLGPALAAELGGEWDDYNRRVWLSDGGYITETSLGFLWIHAPIGRHSDGVEALAAKAREMGAA